MSSLNTTVKNKEWKEQATMTHSLNTTVQNKEWKEQATMTHSLNTTVKSKEGKEQATMTEDEYRIAGQQVLPYFTESQIRNFAESTLRLPKPPSGPFVVSSLPASHVFFNTPGKAPSERQIRRGGQSFSNAAEQARGEYLSDQYSSKEFVASNHAKRQQKQRSFRQIDGKFARSLPDYAPQGTMPFSSTVNNSNKSGSGYYSSTNATSDALRALSSLSALSSLQHLVNSSQSIAAPSIIVQFPSLASLSSLQQLSPAGQNMSTPIILQISPSSLTPTAIASDELTQRFGIPRSQQLQNESMLQSESRNVHEPAQNTLNQSLRSRQSNKHAVPAKKDISTHSSALSSSNLSNYEMSGLGYHREAPVTSTDLLEQQTGTPSTSSTASLSSSLTRSSPTRKKSLNVSFKSSKDSPPSRSLDQSAVPGWRGTHSQISSANQSAPMESEPIYEATFASSEAPLHQRSSMLLDMPEPRFGPVVMVPEGVELGDGNSEDSQDVRSSIASMSSVVAPNRDEEVMSSRGSAGSANSPGKSGNQNTLRNWMKGKSPRSPRHSRDDGTEEQLSFPSSNMQGDPLLSSGDFGTSKALISSVDLPGGGFWGRPRWQEPSAVQQSEPVEQPAPTQRPKWHEPPSAQQPAAVQEPVAGQRPKWQVPPSAEKSSASHQAAPVQREKWQVPPSAEQSPAVQLPVPGHRQKWHDNTSAQQSEIAQPPQPTQRRKWQDSLADQQPLPSSSNASIALSSPQAEPASRDLPTGLSRMDPFPFMPGKERPFALSEPDLAVSGLKAPSSDLSRSGPATAAPEVWPSRRREEGSSHGSWSSSIAMGEHAQGQLWPETVSESPILSPQSQSQVDPLDLSGKNQVLETGAFLEMHDKRQFPHAYTSTPDQVHASSEVPYPPAIASSVPSFMAPQFRDSQPWTESSRNSDLGAEGLIEDGKGVRLLAGVGDQVWKSQGQLEKYGAYASEESTPLSTLDEDGSRYMVKVGESVVGVGVQGWNPQGRSDNYSAYASAVSSPLSTLEELGSRTMAEAGGKIAASLSSTATSIDIRQGQTSSAAVAADVWTAGGSEQSIHFLNMSNTSQLSSNAPIGSSRGYADDRYSYSRPRNESAQAAVASAQPLYDSTSTWSGGLGPTDDLHLSTYSTNTLRLGQLEATTSVSGSQQLVFMEQVHDDSVSMSTLPDASEVTRAYEALSSMNMLGTQDQTPPGKYTDHLPGLRSQGPPGGLPSMGRPGMQGDEGQGGNYADSSVGGSVLGQSTSDMFGNSSRNMLLSTSPDMAAQMAALGTQVLASFSGVPEDRVSRSGVMSAIVEESTSAERDPLAGSPADLEPYQRGLDRQVSGTGYDHVMLETVPDHLASEIAAAGSQVMTSLNRGLNRQISATGNDNVMLETVPGHLAAEIAAVGSQVMYSAGYDNVMLETVPGHLAADIAAAGSQVMYSANRDFSRQASATGYDNVMLETVPGHLASDIAAAGSQVMSSLNRGLNRQISATGNDNVMLETVPGHLAAEIAAAGSQVMSSTNRVLNRQISATGNDDVMLETVPAHLASEIATAGSQVMNSLNRNMNRQISATGHDDVMLETVPAYLASEIAAAGSHAMGSLLLADTPDQFPTEIALSGPQTVRYLPNHQDQDQDQRGEHLDGVLMSTVPPDVADQMSAAGQSMLTFQEAPEQPLGVANSMVSQDSSQPIVMSTHADDDLLLGTVPDETAALVADIGRKLREAMQGVPVEDLPEEPEQAEGVLLEIGNLVVFDEKLLEDSASGAVFHRGEQRERPVAVKIFPEEAARAARTETSTASQLGDRHLLPLLGCELDGGRELLVFESFEQGLVSWVAATHKSAGQEKYTALGYLLFKQVLRGIAALHTQGFAHTRLGPADVVLTGEVHSSAAWEAPAVALINFSQARKLDPSGTNGAALVAEDLRGIGRILAYIITKGQVGSSDQDDTDLLIRRVREVAGLEGANLLQTLLGPGPRPVLSRIPQHPLFMDERERATYLADARQWYQDRCANPTTAIYKPVETRYGRAIFGTSWFTPPPGSSDPGCDVPEGGTRVDWDWVALWDKRIKMPFAEQGGALSALYRFIRINCQLFDDPPPAGTAAVSRWVQQQHGIKSGADMARYFQRLFPRLLIGTFVLRAECETVHYFIPFIRCFHDMVAKEAGTA